MLWVLLLVGAGAVAAAASTSPILMPGMLMLLMMAVLVGRRWPLLLPPLLELLGLAIFSPFYYCVVNVCGVVVHTHTQQPLRSAVVVDPNVVFARML